MTTPNIPADVQVAETIQSAAIPAHTTQEKKPTHLIFWSLGVVAIAGASYF